VPRSAVLVLVALLGTAVGFVDAARTGDSDLGALLAVVVLVQVAALLDTRGRSRINLRPDLATWLRQQSTATGEPVERLADRCVASYRAGLTGERPASPAGAARP
jgi:hypothetical protein